MTDDRLVDIETKLAHQELVVEQLNEIVTEQQARIGRLEETCRSLAVRLQSVAQASSAGAGRPEDDVPPHY
jgi:SlyX protein